MDTHYIELYLILSDLCEIYAIMESLQDSEEKGYLGLILHPTICFVVEESQNYLKNILKTGDIALLSDYSKVITKSRVLIKMFDDNKGGMQYLIQTMNLYKEVSKKMMNISKSGLLGFIGKLVQTDIGIYFLDDNPIYLTTIGFSASGIDREDIMKTSDAGFETICFNAYQFGEVLGLYVSKLKWILEKYSIAIKSNSTKTHYPKLSITHNDFKSDKFYEYIFQKGNMKRRDISAALFFVLCQVNVAYHVLPKLLSTNSNLLFRIQFLTAYHAYHSLLEIQDNIDEDLKKIILFKNQLMIIDNIRKVRNLMAHYGLGEGEKYVSGTSNIFDELILGYTSKSYSEINNIVQSQLLTLSNWTCERYSKHDFSGIRAFFGDHT